MMIWVKDIRGGRKYSKRSDYSAEISSNLIWPITRNKVLDSCLKIKAHKLFPKFTTSGVFFGLESIQLSTEKFLRKCDTAVGRFVVCCGHDEAIGDR